MGKDHRRTVGAEGSMAVNLLKESSGMTITPAFSCSGSALSLRSRSVASSGKECFKNSVKAPRRVANKKLWESYRNVMSEVIFMGILEGSLL